MSLHYSSSFYRTINAVERKHFWFRARNNLIARVVTTFASGNNASFLEVGCGTGIVLKLLSSLGFRVTGIDINKEAISYAQKQVPEARFIRQSIMTYVPDKKDTYDMIGAFDVLEHVANDEVFLGNCHRLLARRGLLFITVPAGKWLWDSLDTHAGHLRRYEPNELTQKLQNAGFQIVWWNYWQTVTLPLYWFWRVLMVAEKREKEAIGDYLKPPVGVVNSMIYWLLRLEQCMIMAFRLPIGASLIIVAQKA